MTSSRKETSTSTPDSSSAPNPSSAPETFDHSSNNSRNYPEQKGAKFRLEDEEEDENFVEIPDSPDKWLDLHKLWLFTGPGFLMSIAYLDPGNIESDLQSGGIAHYKLASVLLLSHILGLVLQRLAARLGVVSGMHMAEVAYEYYPRVPRVLLWIMVEIAIIGSDMQEVIGTAISIYLLSNGNVPLYAGVLLTICDTFSFMFLEKYGVRKFEAFFCFLIGCMAVSFGYEFVVATPKAGELFTGMFAPWQFTYNSKEILQGVSVVGSVIMPHNLYLHSALVKSRRIDRRRYRNVAEANKYYLIESSLALLCSFFINVLVVSVFATSFFGKTNQQIYDSCQNPDNRMPDFYRDVFPANEDKAESDIYHAGIFLGCTFGVAALYVWAIGILAAGQSSTMTGTYAGQFTMEGFIRISLPKWKRILITRSMAIGPTLIVTGFTKGVQHLTGMNDLLNCIMMLQLPFALLPIITFVSDTKIMGEFAASRALKVFSVLASILVVGINIFFVYDYVEDNFGFTALSLSIIITGGIAYLLFVAYLFVYTLIGMDLKPLALSSKFFPRPNYSAFTRPWIEVSPSIHVTHITVPPF